MTLRRPRLAVVGLALTTLAAVAAEAATPQPFTAPPPEITTLVPFASTPLDKPAVTPMDVPAPTIAVDLPALPPATVTPPAVARPVAPLDVPAAPCDTPASRRASDLLECGKRRLKKGAYDEAARALQDAIRVSKDRDVLVQARYWLGEAQARLKKLPEAEATLRPAIGERHEYAVWAAHAAGWIALQNGEAGRAREMFTRALAGAVPPAIDAWARHGLGLAYYAAGKHAEAAQAFPNLSKRAIPADIASDVAFFSGDALGRAGEHARAAQHLKTFVDGARAGSIREHPLLPTGRMRLAWWTLAAGQPREAAGIFRTCFQTTCSRLSQAEQDMAGVGLALALAAAGDTNAARNTARWLSARKSPAAVPVALELMRDAVERNHTPEVLAMAQEALAAPIPRSARAYVLVMKGDALHRDDLRDEARTQYDMAQQTDRGSDVAAYAAYRLAQTDFEMREYAQAAAGLDAVGKMKLAPDLRAATLLLQGEAAYRAGHHAAAAAAFKRMAAEFPRHPQIALIQLSLPWIALRHGQKDEARAQFLAFAGARPDDPHTPDAWLAVADLTLASGDVKAAAQQLDSVIARYPKRPATEVARLNRAILLVRSGQHAAATPVLREWIARAPHPPAVGNAHAALGAALLAAHQPAEAAREFSAAQRRAPSAYASLGAGVALMTDKRLDDAARALNDARTEGSTEITALAEYALAAVGLERGRLKDFKQPALAALKQAPSGPHAAKFLYILTGIATETRDFAGALDTAKKLLQQLPNDELADDALERIGAAASKLPNWPVVYESYALLRQRYPKSPFTDRSTRLLAEAAFQTGRGADARRDLEQVVAATPTDGPAWMMLAEARRTGGDRPGAIEAYTQAAKVIKITEWKPATILDHARLLVLEKRWPPARTLFERLLKSDDPALVLEATHSIGDTYRGEDNLALAAQYYMTAAYLAPESPLGRRSLLAAGQTFTALKQHDQAATVYRKLLSQTDVPGDLAAAARQGLQALKNN